MPSPDPPCHGIEHNRKRDAEIRAMWATGQFTRKSIARRFHISESRVCQIINRRSDTEGNHHDQPA